MNVFEILNHLKSLGDPTIIAHKKQYGNTAQNSWGIKTTELRKFAKETGINHSVALELYDSEIHEAKLLAAMIADPEIFTETQMEQWATSFDSWDVCDTCCSTLFVKTQFAYSKAIEWSNRSEEFVKRAAFTMMAHLVFHDKTGSDEKFEQFFPVILREANDERNFVKKAVNWALRQIGKRNPLLNKKAIIIAEKLITNNSKSAIWIGRHALRELTGSKINILNYPRDKYAKNK